MLFWFGLAILAIPFIMTEFSIAKNEEEIKQSKVEIANLKKEIEDLKTKPILQNESQPATVNSLEKEVSNEGLLIVETALKEEIGKQDEKISKTEIRFADIGPISILQINATVITGALILLTIATTSDFGKDGWNRYSVTIATIALLMPFAGSSFWIFEKGREKAAFGLTRWGFMVLMIGLTFLRLLVLPIKDLMQ